MGSVAKSYARKDFLIYEKMRKYLTASHICLCNRSLLKFLIYEETLFSFLSVWHGVFSQMKGILAVVFISCECCYHKVRTYKEYHSVCPSSELGLSQPLSRQRVFPSPQKQGGGGTLACGWGVGGSPNSDEGHTLWYSLYLRTLWLL
jgi:hypothetical protein